MSGRIPPTAPAARAPAAPSGPGDDALLADLVRGLADAVVIADADGVITFWNPAATRLFGWDSAEALGQTLDLIIPERLRQRHWDGYRRTMATGHTDYGDRLLEVPASHRDGRRLSIAFTVTLLSRPGDSQQRAIAAVIRDDTERWQERRRVRDELAELRAASAAGQRLSALEIAARTLVSRRYGRRGAQ